MERKRAINCAVARVGAAAWAVPKSVAIVACIRPLKYAQIKTPNFVNIAILQLGY